MPRLSLARLASASPMGAQVYQEEVLGRAAAQLGDGWSVQRMTFRSVRSTLPGTHRFPVGRLALAGRTARRATGRVLYPRGVVLHRMNLELPPHPSADVVTLHDIVSWKFDDETPPVPAAAAELRRARAVVCVSQFTADEAAAFLGLDNLHVVPNGVHERFLDAAPLPAAELAALGVVPPFVLASGGATKRKNLDALATAWPRVHEACPDLTLVLSGPRHGRRTELFGGLPGVRLVGRVDDAVIPGLMAAATLMVVPSTYEGFGLPALEAMAVGVPVVAADASSLPEVVGEDGLLVPPTPDGLAEGMVHAHRGRSSLDAMVARGRSRARELTWERSVAAHADIWRRVADGSL